MLSRSSLLLLPVVFVCLLAGCAPQATTGSRTQPLIIQPSGEPLVLMPGEVRVFQASYATGAPIASSATEVAWSCSEGVGTVDAETGEFTAVKTVSSDAPVTGTVTLTIGDATYDTDVRVELTDAALRRMAIYCPTDVVLDQVSPGQEIQFTAEATDLLGNRSVGSRVVVPVTWSCDANIGTINSSTGLFTAATTGDGVDFTGEITAQQPSGMRLNASVELTLSFPPDLGAAPTALSFGEATTELPVTITNLGTEELTWQASTDATWLSVSPSSGTNGGELTVTVDRAGLAGGQYTGVVSLTSNGGASTVACTMDVTTMTVIIQGQGGSQ